MIIFFMIGTDVSYAFAWFWSKKEAPKTEEAITPALEIQPMPDANQYSRIVKNIASKNVFVVCSVCPAGSKLERDMQEVNIAIRMSSSGVPDPGTDSTARPPTMETARLGATAVTPVQNETIQESAIEAVPPEPLPARKEPKEDVRSPCIDSPVYFDLNSAEVSFVEKKKLLDSTGILKNGGDIEVTGYTCDIGTKDYNDELAIKRANSVGDVLVREIGVPVVTIKGMGKCCYVSDDKSKNRRVEITCIKNQ
jgi:outer membrane protein OmpA-like peptidoglycan-associated protein